MNLVQENGYNCTYDVDYRIAHSGLHILTWMLEAAVYKQSTVVQYHSTGYGEHGTSPSGWSRLSRFISQAALPICLALLLCHILIILLWYIDTVFSFLGLYSPSEPLHPFLCKVTSRELAIYIYHRSK